MKTVVLGRTSLKVSRIGIGGIPITRPSEKDAIQIMQHALDLGINFIDTSIAYKDSEERIGKAIAGRRDEVVVRLRAVGKTKRRQSSTARATYRLFQPQPERKR